MYINNGKVDIYRRPTEKYYLENEKDYNNACYFIHLIASYKPIKIFIGKSPLNEVTKSHDSFGKEFDGNSILLRLDEKKYVSVSMEIYEFTINDDIITYYSPVGNSDVPYPFAIGKKNVYFIMDKVYVSRKNYDACVPKNNTFAYNYFYGHEGKCNFKKKNLNFKIIQKRTF